MRITAPVPAVLLLPWAVLLLVGCAGLRYVPEDEELYTGADLEIESEKRVPRRRRLESELEDGIRPQPNTTWLGLVRPGLWVYGVTGDAEVGLRGRANRRFGEPPVLFHEASPERTAETLRRRLGNKGYFDAELSYEIERRRRRAGVTYRATLFEPFRISEFHGPPGETVLERAVNRSLEDTLVEIGEVYSLDTLLEERARIDRALKEDGFFYFNSDYLEYVARTDANERTVALELQVKPDAPARARRRYRVGDVLIHDGRGADYGDGEVREPIADGVYLVGGKDGSRYRAEVLADAVLLRSGERYSRRAHLDSISRLIDLGVFQAASIRYRETGDGETLDAEVFLTPAMEKSLQAELRAVVKSNDYAGPGLTASYLDRNLWGGAEQFELQLLSSFETEIGTAAFTLDSYELGAEASVSLPRILGPLPIGTAPSRTLPRTRVRTGYRSLTRIDAYRLDSFNAGYLYSWSSDEFTRHEWRPVDATIVRPRDFASEFQQLLDDSPALQRAFDEQFIAATGYLYRYDTRRDDARRHHRYFGFELESAGNLVHAAQLLRKGEGPDSDDPYTVFGVPYSQYLRADSDSRAYVGVTENSTLAMRFLAGAGRALGNSETMPSIRQFTVGGTNSMRAFAARSIGPGSVARPDGGTYSERLGDMRLEGNLEYRFPLFGLFHGALFLDAGNIWNLGDDKDLPGSGFEPERAVDQLYLGTGAGFRLTTPILVLRLDVAFPLREADRPSSERWVVDEIDFRDRGWRADNLSFNLAIGYPF